MSRELTSDELSLWQAAMSGVKPLNGRPVSPTVSLNPVRVPKPSHVPFSPVIDLHGLTIQAAYHAVQDHIDQAIELGWRRLTVITGKSGTINVELPRWVGKRHEVRSVKSMNGGGAYEIWLKKDTSTQKR